MSPTQQNKLTVLVKRFLDVMRILFLALAVIWPITIMVVGLNIPSDPQQRHTDVSVYSNFRISSDIAADLPAVSGDKAVLLLSGKGNLLLNNTLSRWSWYISGAITEALLFVFLYGLLTMRKLFASLTQGNTFTQDNVKRIRTVGYVFIGFNIVSPVLQYFGGRIMLQEIAFNAPGVQLYPGFELNIGGLFAGFAILVLSGVLREAASIHQEQSLTI